ncbi:MAG: 50S ribosomal protein L10 [Myxococcota bacterium]|jgi:large subunit ribosomal protein L10
MLTRQQKEDQVTELKDKFERATSVFVADYRGLGVLQMEALRGGLRKADSSDAEFRVAKNSVLRLASQGGPAEGLQEHFTGTTSIAISFGDPVALAKTLVDYAKANEQFELRGAVLDGEVLDASGVQHLSTLPSLDELRGKIVGLLQAPATKLVRLLNEPGAQIARVMSAKASEGGE